MHKLGPEGEIYAYECANEYLRNESGFTQKNIQRRLKRLVYGFRPFDQLEDNVQAALRTLEQLKRLSSSEDVTFVTRTSATNLLNIKVSTEELRRRQADSFTRLLEALRTGEVED